MALLPFFLFFLVKGRYEASLIIFFIGSITDGLDGFVARRFHQVTDLGKILDPAADKIFLLATLTTLYLLGLLPLWFFIPGIAKDLVILTGSALIRLKCGKLDIKPTFSGKAATAFQMATILLILFHCLGYVTESILLISMIATAMILFYSTLSYAIIGISIYKGGQPVE